MRPLVIALLIIGVTFVGMASYALIRDPVPTGSSSSTSCASPPPMKDGEVDEDAAQEWCRDPPALVARLSRRFGPRTRFLSHELSVPGNRLEVTADAPPSDPDKRDQAEGKMRIAPFEWRGGGPVLIRYKDQRLCLCRPGAALDPVKVEECGEGWISHRITTGGTVMCGENDGQGALVLDVDGGRLSFRALADRSVVAHPSP